MYGAMTPTYNDVLLKNAAVTARSRRKHRSTPRICNWVDDVTSQRGSVGMLPASPSEMREPFFMVMGKQRSSILGARLPDPFSQDSTTFDDKDLSDPERSLSTSSSGESDRKWPLRSPTSSIVQARRRSQIRRRPDLHVKIADRAYQSRYSFQKQTGRQISPRLRYSMRSPSVYSPALRTPKTPTRRAQPAKATYSVRFSFDAPTNRTSTYDTLLSPYPSTPVAEVPLPLPMYTTPATDPAKIDREFLEPRAAPVPHHTIPSFAAIKRNSRGRIELSTVGITDVHEDVSISTLERIRTQLQNTSARVLELALERRRRIMGGDDLIREKMAAARRQREAAVQGRNSQGLGQMGIHW